MNGATNKFNIINQALQAWSIQENLLQVYRNLFITFQGLMFTAVTFLFGISINIVISDSNRVLLAPFHAVNFVISYVMLIFMWLSVIGISLFALFVCSKFREIAETRGAYVDFCQHFCIAADKINDIDTVTNFMSVFKYYQIFFNENIRNQNIITGDYRMKYITALNIEEESKYRNICQKVQEITDLNSKKTMRARKVVGIPVFDFLVFIWSGAILANIILASVVFCRIQF